MSRVVDFAAKIAPMYLQRETWGYGCDVDTSPIGPLLELEQFMMLQGKYGGKCLASRDHEMFSRRVRALGPSPATAQVIIYEGKLTEWQYANPTCIPRPYYVKYCESLICDIRLESISAEVITQVCNIDVDILVEAGRCDLAIQSLAIAALSETCDLTTTATVTQQDCDLAISQAAAQTPCDVDLTAARNTLTALTKK